MGGESLLPSASMPRLTWRQSFWAHEVQVRQAVALSTFFCTHYMAQYYHNHIDPATVVAAQYATNLANLLSSNFIVWEMFRVISLSKDVDRLRCGLDRLWLCHYNINSVGFNTNPCELKTSPILTKIELAGAQSDYLQMARMIDTHGTARAFKNCMDILLTVQIVFLSPLSIVEVDKSVSEWWWQPFLMPMIGLMVLMAYAYVIPAYEAKMAQNGSDQRYWVACMDYPVTPRRQRLQKKAHSEFMCPS